SDTIVHWAAASTKRQLLVYTANSNGTYNAGVNFSSTHKHNPYSWACSLFVADVNGDGCDDFIVKWRKASGTTTVFVHPGSSSGFSEAITTTTSLAFFMG
ncbi:MAG: VCBS repeat-containing protein, partial [Clostridia bacterium]|nr:VCBS repeat-containing protein [Clostridia bacterium]